MHHIRRYSSKTQAIDTRKKTQTRLQDLIVSARDFLQSACWWFAPADAAPGRFDEFAFREASAPPLSPRPEVEMMSVGAMRSLISSAGLSSADCVEKSELRAGSVVALERLAE